MLSLCLIKCDQYSSWVCFKHHPKQTDSPTASKLYILLPVPQQSCPNLSSAAHCALPSWPVPLPAMPLCSPQPRGTLVFLHVAMWSERIPSKAPSSTASGVVASPTCLLKSQPNQSAVLPNWVLPHPTLLRRQRRWTAFADSPFPWPAPFHELLVFHGCQPSLASGCKAPY